MCGCCVSECNSMESDPEFFGPAALAKGFRFVGDPRDRATVERLEAYNDEHGIWDCTRCYFCNERCPKGVDPRDAIAKLGAESIKHRASTETWARSTPSGSSTRRRRPAGCARRSSCRRRRADRAASRRRSSRSRSPGAARCRSPFPPHVGEERAGGSRALRHREGAGPRGRAGIVQGEKALGRMSEWSRRRARPVRRGLVPEPSDRPSEPAGSAREGRLLQGLPRVALGEGARHLDAGARAEARASSSTSSSRSPAAARATSTRPSPTTTST